MAYTNLEALNELIQKIKAGEGTAKSNLEALNMLCVIAGGTGAARSNLEALNELLRVFTPGGETQEKSVTITENGTTEITPDEGYTLSKAVVVTEVPSKPEQTKSVTLRANGITEVAPDPGHVLTGVTINTAVPKKMEQTKTVIITENGTTEITPDEGYTISSASVSVNVSGGSDGNATVSTIVNPGLSGNITKVNLNNVTLSQHASCTSLFNNLLSLQEIIWGNFLANITKNADFTNAFRSCESLKNVDFSSANGLTVFNIASMFYSCTALESINWGSMKLKPTSWANAFNDCSVLAYIDLSAMDTSVLTSTAYGSENTFQKCYALTNVVFENNCFSNSKMTKLSFVDCPLSHDCAVDIFNKLATRTNSPTLKLSTTTKGYLTDDEIAIATSKGWVVS